MINEIGRIILSSELRHNQSEDTSKEIADVFVEFKNGDLYSASFFTYSSIDMLRQQHIKNGDYLKGNYFWANGMILINDCKKEQIEKVIRDLIDVGDFFEAFKKFEITGEEQV